MANESILISEVIPASPQRIFSAWLDSAEHSAFTGDDATVVPEIGGEHRASGGYIQGRTLELQEGSRIVQSWRTTEFPADCPDSRLEITLEPTLGGTLVTLLHTDIPSGQSERYRQSWNEFYLSRMKVYFGGGDADEGGEEAVLELVPEEDESEATGTTPIKATKPVSKPASKPATKVPAAKKAASPAAKAAAPAPKPAAKPATKPATKPAKKPAAKRVAKTALAVKRAPAKPIKSAAKRATKHATKKSAKPAAKRAAARRAKPGKKPVAKARAKAKAPAAAKRAKPASKPKAKSAARGRRRG